MDGLLDHMDALHKLNWDLLGQDYDGYDGDGLSRDISQEMIAAGLGEKGSLDIPANVWEDTVPMRLICDIRKWKSGPECGRFNVWQPTLHTTRMIGVLVDDEVLCRSPEFLTAFAFADLSDIVLVFIKPKNDVKCSFIIDMRNSNDRSEVSCARSNFRPSIRFSGPSKERLTKEISCGALRWTAPTFTGAYKSGVNAGERSEYRGHICIACHLD